MIKLCLHRLMLCATLACAVSVADEHESATEGELAAYVGQVDASFAWREVASGHVGASSMSNT